MTRNQIKAEARRSYHVPFFLESEFEADVGHILTLIRMLNDWRRCLKPNQALNDFISSVNCFGLLFLERMLVENVSCPDVRDTFIAKTCAVVGLWTERVVCHDEFGAAYNPTYGETK